MQINVRTKLQKQRHNFVAGRGAKRPCQESPQNTALDASAKTKTRGCGVGILRNCLSDVKPFRTFNSFPFPHKAATHHCNPFCITPWCSCAEKPMDTITAA
uniref:Uncharacterized protein n=1 Tax=Eutreptiella gymnastica TaxID=73025 RepID=A0A6T2ETG0_9EUGL|mmetsp:Transcript_36319/g.59343  ORF Transcript_36319/g.59343 Transcript_36319/m.59343 type:complete len:101 (+) Transcript_36319:231-533(+)